MHGMHWGNKVLPGKDDASEVLAIIKGRKRAGFAANGKMLMNGSDDLLVCWWRDANEILIVVLRWGTYLQGPDGY
jgi:hypothetical protein